MSFLNSTYEAISLGQVKLLQQAGQMADDIELLFFNYFFLRRDRIPLRHVDRFMTISDILNIIEDALEIIVIEKPYLVEVDWKGQYQLKGI